MFSAVAAAVDSVKVALLSADTNPGVRKSKLL